MLRITTRSSIWTLDFDAMICTRVPRSEDPDHPLPYRLVGSPEAFQGKVKFYYEGPHQRADIHLVAKGPVTTGYIEKTEEI